MHASAFRGTLPFDPGGVLHRSVEFNSRHGRRAACLHGNPVDRLRPPDLPRCRSPRPDVPPASTLSFYDELVANNQNVTLHVYPEEDHSGTVLASLPDSTPFLRRAVADHQGAGRPHPIYGALKAIRGGSSAESTPPGGGGAPPP